MDVRADTLKELDIGRERLTGHRGQARICFVALSPAPLAFGGCRPRIDLVELVRRSGKPMFADWLRRRRRSPRLPPALVGSIEWLALLNDQSRRDLLEILDDRHNQKSTLLTSQLPIDKWHDYLGQPTFADAILDRLVHNAHKLNLKGESMRKNNNNLTTNTNQE